MKPLLCALLIACFLFSLTGCFGETPAVSVAATLPATTASEQTTMYTEQTEPFLSDYLYDYCPQFWAANCEEYLNLYPSPDSSEELMRILPGESMELLGWYGIYAWVVCNGQEGYVLSQYITPADSNALTELLTVVKPTATYTYEQMNKDIALLTDAYPHICTTEPIGSSEEGRDIPVLRIGNSNAGYHILIQGSIHAREHMTAWLVMALADYWLANGIADRTDVCYHLIPMTNPDGVAISQSGTLSDSQIAIYHHDRQTGKTKEKAGDYAAHWKANALGTDLNRNFPSGWENLQDVTAPSFQRYPGSAPFSAAETAALRDYTLRYTFDSTVSYHAFGSMIYYEYGTREPVNTQSYLLAEAVQLVTGYPPEGSSLTEGGGYKDWAMDALGIPSLTIEIGCDTPPLEERELQSIFFRNLRVLPAVAQWLTE